MGLGSGIRKKPIPDPGVKKAADPGSGFATLQKRCLDIRFRFIQPFCHRLFDLVFMFLCTELC
jgi:hypothetical protein